MKSENHFITKVVYPIIVGVVLASFALFIKLYFDKSERKETTQNAPKIILAEKLPDKENNSKTKPNINHDAKEDITKPSIPNKETEIEPDKKPISPPKNNPSTKPIDKPKLTETTTKTAAPPKATKTPKYFNSNQHYDIAILSKSKKSNIETLFKTHFKTKGFKSSSSVFKSSFKSSNYFKNLEEDASGLKAIGLDKTINCICLIDENIRFEKKEQFGTAYLKATGNYAIAIIDINSGEIDNYNIETIGSGTSESLATASVHEHLIENKNFKNINIDLCKK